VQRNNSGAIALDSQFENAAFPSSLKERKTDGFSYKEKQGEMSLKCVFPLSAQPWIKLCKL
jgi:hypothetical protein